MIWDYVIKGYVSDYPEEEYLDYYFISADTKREAIEKIKKMHGIERDDFFIYDASKTDRENTFSC